MDSNPSLTWFTTKGRLTNIIATTMPEKASTKLMLRKPSGSPMLPCLPNTVRSAIPATVCGTTIERSTSFSDPFPPRLRTRS